MRILPISLVICVAGLAGAAADEALKRAPSEVMSFLGADWLERPSREREEQPDAVIATMKLKPGMVVGDIGAGTGFFARRIAKVVAPGGEVLAVDIQPEMLELLEEYCAKEKIENVRPILGTETDPKLEAESCDWLLLVDVYHEFQQPAPMLEKLRRALKPAGRVALVEYRLKGETARHIRESHRMSKEQVLAEWGRAGFELVEVLEFLPSQHLFIFEKGAGDESEPPGK